MVLEDRFAFVTATGHAGTFGRKLESVNINYSTGDVALVLGVTSDATEDHRFRFAKEVSFGVSERNELSWELDPSSEEGSIIYKVTARLSTALIIEAWIRWSSTEVASVASAPST